MKKQLTLAVCLLTAFGLWTALVCLVDVRAIGPMGSAVGFARLNGWFHRLTGVHQSLYVITDILSLIPIGVALGFAALGLSQWIGRKKLSAVDHDILRLGGFYIITAAAYLFFEVFVVNVRPVLIEGKTEASYPSSTTVLVLCIMFTAIMQIRLRIKNKTLRNILTVATCVFSVFMVVGRSVCGVHWLTDIIGGLLLGAGLVMIYRFFCHFE